MPLSNIRYSLARNTKRKYQDVAAEYAEKHYFLGRIRRKLQAVLASWCVSAALHIFSDSMVLWFFDKNVSTVEKKLNIDATNRLFASSVVVAAVIWLTDSRQMSKRRGYKKAARYRHSKICTY
jgi:hypothetical protein